MDGWLDWEQAQSLNPVEMGGRSLERREIRRHLGASSPQVKAPIRLVVTQARAFEIRDRAKIGVTVPERFESYIGRVEIIGLMDCDITVWTQAPTASYFELGPLDLDGYGLGKPQGKNGDADNHVDRGGPLTF